MPALLNLGCGSRYCADPSWTNIDFVSTGDRVASHDLSEGIPHPEGSFDVVYHSHVLEHFRRIDANRFLGECFRVLGPGGTIRVAVPDLEQICRLYLLGMKKTKAGDPGWKRRYDWMMIEMYDQAVRTQPGGEMAIYLRTPDLPEKEFILGRIGGAGRAIVSPPLTGKEGKRRVPAGKKLARKVKSGAMGLRRLAASLFLTRREKEALSLGLFRLGGEIHQWMYDEYSLSERLREAGFARIRRCGAGESAIPGWNSYGLDVGSDGLEHAPNSLYMEAVKPEDPLDIPRR